MSTIKEALAALERLRLNAHSNYTHAPVGCWFCEPAHAITNALEAAQQEAEAWEAIEAWVGAQLRTGQVANGHMVLIDIPAVFREEWQATLLSQGRELAFVNKAGTGRLEALAKAAAWCRAETARAGAAKTA